MGKVYDRPERRGFIVVCDPDPRVEEPPAPDEGEILNVTFDRTHACGGDHHWNRCLSCPKTFMLTEPHVHIHVYLYANAKRLHGNHVTGRCCSRECWAEWATR